MRMTRDVARDATRLFRLSLIDGVPDIGRFRTIVTQLLASQRRRRFAVAEALLRLLKRDVANRTAEIYSAAPLDSGARAALEAGLARRYQREIATTFVADPALIGGIRIMAGSDLYDDSIKARLSAMETA